MARSGFPWLTVDMEHTHTDIQTAAMMFGAIADAGCVPLARVPAGKHEWIKMVLDCGAMGIVAPMVMDAAEAASHRRGDQVRPAGQSLGRRRLPRDQLRRDRRGLLPPRRRRDPRRHPDRAHPSRRGRRRDLRRSRHRRHLHRAQRPGLLDALGRRSHALEGGVRNTLTRILRGRPAPSCPLRPPCAHGRRCPAACPAGLSVHRRRQRAQVHARRRGRRHAPAQSGREAEDLAKY